MKAVIDTNVLLVANGDHADVSEDSSSNAFGVCRPCRPAASR